jgi:protein-tyrosine-phosphatase
LEGLTPRAASGRRAIQSVLFICAHNAVRSPMAEAIANHYFGRSLYVRSAGVLPGDPDPFVAAVLDEAGIDAPAHKPRTIEELDDWEGLNFDLAITLSPEAHHRALELTRTLSIDVEYWPTPDPTREVGSRERRLEAYRAVRDGLQERVLERFRK